MNNIGVLAQVQIGVFDTKNIFVSKFPAHWQSFVSRVIKTVRTARVLKATQEQQAVPIIQTAKKHEKLLIKNCILFLQSLRALVTRHI